MRFSVITPVYNGADTLEAARATLAAQTFRDFEWVVVDDGSTDGTSELLDRFAAEDPAVRVIHQANAGVSVARNRGMDEARGEYLVWLDADDAFTPDALAYVDSLATAMPEAEAFHFPFVERGSEGKVRRPAREGGIVSGEEAFNRLFVNPKTRGQHYQPWRFVYRRGIVLPHFRPGAIHEDIDVLPVHLSTLSKVYVSGSPFYVYTPVREGAATQAFTPKRVRDILVGTERNWGCVPLRPLLIWNLWGYFRATERFAEPEHGELMAKFRAHPEYLGLTASQVDRNPGVDACRVLSMFLIVLGHVVGLGGVDVGEFSSLQKIQSRVLESFAQCGAPVFAIISGYFLVNARFGFARWRKFAKLWWQVVSTGLLVLAACSPFLATRASDWLTAALPLTRQAYWYFNGYALVFLLAPGLAMIAKKPCSRWVALVLFLGISATVFFPGGIWMLGLHNGYSGVWLVILAFYGMVLRNWLKTPPKPVWCGVAAVAAVAVTVAQRVVMAAVPALKDYFENVWTLSSTLSPTEVVLSVALVLGCLQLRLGRRARKLIWALSPLTFGVYLLHVQPFFFDNCFKGNFAFIGRLPGWAFAVSALAVSGFIFVALLALEKLRSRADPARWISALTSKFNQTSRKEKTK